MSSPPNASDTQIRARLLNRLGIYDSGAQQTSSQPLSAAQNRRLRILRGMGVGYTLRPSPPDGSAIRPPLGNVIPYTDKLRAEPPLSTCSSLEDSNKSSRRIMFKEEVEILPIPTRNEYSERIKSLIWSNRHELQENAERNAREYAAEGWDWRGVTEDEGMYICSISGELVHPIHLQEHIQLQQAAAAGQDDVAASPGLERGAPVHSN